MAFDVGAAEWVARVTDFALARSTDSGSLARGRAYAQAGMVRSISTADRGRVLIGEVSGSGRESYNSLVTRMTDSQTPTWVGRCSCPVGSNCKHCIAVLLTARSIVGDAPDPYAGALGSSSSSPSLGTAGGAGGLFTGQGEWRGQNVRVTPSWQQELDPLVAAEPDLDDDAAREPLGLMVTQVERTTTPGRRVFGLVLRPTRLSRAGTWSASWSWDQALGAMGSRTLLSEHVALGLELCRMDQSAARYGYIHRPQTIDLGPLGPDFWPWLVRALDAGVELVAGPVKGPSPGGSRYGTRPRRPPGALPASSLMRPVSSVELAHESVHVELAATSPADGSLTLRANLLGVPGVEGTRAVADLVGAGSAPRVGVVIHPLGHPVHGVAVLAGDTLHLAPIQPVLPTAYDRLFAGGDVVIPEPDVDRFLSFYYPRLRRRLPIVSPDGSVDLAEPDPVRLHVRVEMRSVADVAVTSSWRYPGRDGPTLVSPLDEADATVRDTLAEREILARATVLDLLPGVRWSVPGGRWRIESSVTVRGQGVADFVRDVLPVWEADEDLEVEVIGELPAYAESTETPVIRWIPVVEGAEAGDWLDLHVTVTVGEEKVPFEPLFQALARGDEVMLLDSGTWFSLDHASLDELRRLIEEARELGDPIRDGARISRFQVDLFAELLELGIVDRQSREWADRMIAIRDGIAPAVDEVPLGVKADLRPYQREGFQWLATLWDAGLGAVLADDMGLGKTLQTLAVVQRAHDRGELAAPVLVVAPTSVLSTWRDEAMRFTPDLTVALVGETTRRRKGSLAEVIAGAQVVVTSYAVFRIDAEAFRALPWRALVLDEAQALKNSASQTYQAARRLRAPFKMVVTGTPLENSLMDLWSLLSVVAPGLYAKRDQFSQHYRRPIEVEGNTELLARLRRRIRPLMLRRTKEAVASDLPPKQVQVLPVPLHPVHQRIYDQHLQRERQRLLGLLDDPTANRIAILASLTRLRQLSLDPVLVDEAHAGKAQSAKITELIDHLVELRQEGHRALVFSQFTGYLKLVESALREAGVSTAYLDGRTRNRPAVIDGFRTGDSTAFLISLKAGGTGLTLTEADYVFVLDPWWNPATEAQAVDRAHRIGQTRPVMVYRMVSSGTIEDKVVALQDRKRDLFDRVVEGGDAMGGVITPDDIRALLTAD